MNPLTYGMSVTHLQKMGNFDLGVGASYFNDQGYIRGTPEIMADTVFNKGESEKRAKIYFNTRVRNRKIDGLTFMQIDHANISSVLQFTHGVRSLRAELEIGSLR